MQRLRVGRAAAMAGLVLGFLHVPRADAVWTTFAEDSQHTAVSAVAAQSLEVVHWAAPVDLAPPSGEIEIPSGSPLVTAANTVIIPVKTGSSDGYEVQARRGNDGSLLWSATTDYVLPPHNRTPSYSPTLGSSGRLYFA